MSPVRSAEILRTRLYRPRPPERLVLRRRLFRQLEEGLGGRITLITAPAGYGKTILLSSWLDENPRPACWVSLDEGGDDLFSFLAYLIAAVQTVFPQACSTAESLLQAVDPPPITVLQAYLVNELDDLPQKLIIILDDYHLIRSPEIHDFLTHLVNHLPANLHLVISSRGTPPLALPVWRSRAQLNEIDSRDLRFTFEEAEQFLKQTLRLPLPADMLQIIQDKAEGWVAGLQLTALSLRSAIDPARFVATFQKYGSETIREFLLDQAFRHQPSPIQEFLLKTSILDRFSASLGNAVGLTGENIRSTQDTINVLRRTNLFIVPVDDEGEWYRYHNLFADMLRRRLHDVYEPEEISNLQRRAAFWFEKNELIDDAVRHALASGDTLLAAEIVEKHSIRALNLEKNAMIDRWLMALPANLVETRPRLMMMRLWIESYREHGLSKGNTAYMTRIEHLLENHSNELEPDIRTLLDGYVSALRPHYLINIGSFELGVKLSEHALAILPPQHHYVRGRALMGWALCMQASGRGDEAVRHLIRERDTQSEVNSYSLVVYQALACLFAMSGRLDELEQAATCLYGKANAHGYQILTGWAYYLLGLAAYIGNDMQKACQYFQQAVNMRYLISKTIVREAYVGLCLAQQAAGNTAAVETNLNQLDDLEGFEINEYQRSLRARLAMNGCHLQQPQSWQLKDPFTLPACLFAWLELPHFTQARLWVKDGQAEELANAVDLLGGLIPLAEKMGSIWRMIEGKVWLASALYRQMKQQQACQVMDEAVRLAMPRSFYRLFIEAGPLAAEILNRLDCRDTAFVKQILADLHSDQTIQVEHPLLTHRELEVLRLLNQHLSEREIAECLSVSLDTVKKHCYHIYNKLGVNNRREALAAARQNGQILS